MKKKWNRVRPRKIFCVVSRAMVWQAVCVLCFLSSEWKNNGYSFLFDSFMLLRCILELMHRCCHRHATFVLLLFFVVAIHSSSELLWAVFIDQTWFLPLMIWCFGFQHNAFDPFPPRSLASPVNADCCGQALKVYRFHCEPKRHIKRILTSIPYFLLLSVLFQNTTDNSQYFIVILAFHCLLPHIRTAVAIGVKECNIHENCDGAEWKIKTVESNFCIASDIRSSIEWRFLWHAHSNLWQRWYI